MTTWNVNEFLKLADSYCDTSRHLSIRSAVNSVAWKLRIAAYHARHSLNALSDVTPTYTEATKQIFLDAADSAESLGYREALFESEAHLIACAQALHSTGDILAHGVFWVTAPDISAIDEPRIGLHAVIKELSRNPGCSGVYERLCDLRDAEAFAYVNAYVNVTKHRSLLDFRYSVQFETESVKHGIRILPFNYKNLKYQEIWSDKLSEEYRTAIGESIVAVGNALNQWLQTAV